MATDRTRYVNTASTSGGDGTTNATSGANRAYPSLSAALTAEATADADLVTGDERLVLICEGTTADTTSFTINGATWTTNATSNYIYIKCTTGHQGVFSTSYYRLSNGTGSLVTISGGADVVFEGVQFTNSGVTNDTYAVTVTGSGSTGRFERCIFKGTALTTANKEHCGLLVQSAGAVKASNCLFDSYKNSTSGADWGWGVKNNSDTTSYVYNCTAVNCDRGYRDYARTSMYLKNCLAYNNTDGFNGTWISGSNYNASDQAADAPGANSRNSQTFTFAGGSDYHLSASDAGAKGYGTDLSGDSGYAISVDVDNVTRTGSWDIGFDQTVASSSGWLSTSGPQNVGAGVVSEMASRLGGVLHY